MTVALTWKVHNQIALTMATFGPCSTSGDTHLKDHLHSATRNAMLINILGDNVRDTILNKIHNS